MAKKAQPLFSFSRIDLEFPVQLKRRSGVALHIQLANQLREAIRTGRLEAGSRIPSSRQLASTLNIDRNVIIIAFGLLLSEEFLIAKPGSGTFVTNERLTSEPMMTQLSQMPHRWAKPSTPEESNPPSRAKTITFSLGQPSVTELDLSAWRSIWCYVGISTPSNEYSDPQGDLGLRTAIAQYLGRSRGLSIKEIRAGASRLVKIIRDLHSSI